jgi:hypothetical protein
MHTMGGLDFVLGRRDTELRVSSTSVLCAPRLFFLHLQSLCAMADTTTKDGDIELSVVPTRSADRRDEVALARQGKKAVLKRRFGFLSILGFSCTVLITWEGSLV